MTEISETEALGKLIASQCSHDNLFVEYAARFRRRFGLDRASDDKTSNNSVARARAAYSAVMEKARIRPLLPASWVRTETTHCSFFGPAILREILYDWVLEYPGRGLVRPPLGFYFNGIWTPMPANSFLGRMLD